MPHTLLAPANLGVHDRCDRCGAQAFFRAVYVAGELLFCGHHGRAYGRKLAATALLLEDESAAISGKPSPAVTG